MIRLQSAVVTNDSVQITYVEEAHIDSQSGIMEARILDVPHDVLPQPLLDDLIDAAFQIVDHARAIRRQPTDELRANR